MTGRQAKTITPHTLRRALALAGRSSAPERDQTMILLSVRAGLRACEIAGLEWSMVCDVFRLAKVTPISGISASKNDPLSLRL